MKTIIIEFFPLLLHPHLCVQVQADLHIPSFSICGFSYPRFIVARKKFGKLKK